MDRHQISFPPHFAQYLHLPPDHTRIVEMMDIGRTGFQSIPRYRHDRLHPTTMTDEVHDNEAYPPGIRRTSMAVAIPVDRVGAHVRDIRV